jgi:hypothetical protein
VGFDDSSVDVFGEAEVIGVDEELLAGVLQNSAS